MGKNLATIPEVLKQRPYITERWFRRIRAERRITTYTAAGRVLFDIDELGRAAVKAALRYGQRANNEEA